MAQKVGSDILFSMVVVTVLDDSTPNSIQIGLNNRTVKILVTQEIKEKKCLFSPIE